MIFLSAKTTTRTHRQICPHTSLSCWRRFITLGLVRGFDDVPTVAANYVNFRDRGLVAPIGGAVPGPAHHRGKVDPPALLRNASLHAELTRESENCRGGHRVRTPSSAQVAATLLDTIFEKAHRTHAGSSDCRFQLPMSYSKIQCRADAVMAHRASGRSSRNRFSMKLSCRCGIRCGGLVRLLGGQHRPHDVVAGGG